VIALETQPPKAELTIPLVTLLAVDVNVVKANDVPLANDVMLLTVTLAGFIEYK